MNPVEKSRLKETCSVQRFITIEAVPNCWLMPKFPNAVPARTSVAIGGAVMKFTTPPNRVRPVHGRPAAVQHLDPLNRLERHRQVHVVMPGLRIVHPQPIHQHQGLPEGSAANRQIGLHSVRPALLQIHLRIETQNIDQARIERPRVAHLQPIHVAIGVADIDRLIRPGDDDLLLVDGELGVRLGVVVCRSRARRAGGIGIGWVLLRPGETAPKQRQPN